MTELTTSARDNSHRENSYLDGGGLGSWVNSRDHKRIGFMFLGWAMVLFLLGGIEAVYYKLRIGSGAGVDAGTMSRMLTYHGVIMAFLVVVPLIPAALGNFLLPLQLGARNLALPTLARCSLRWYVVGSLLVLVSLMLYPVGTTWQFHNPYTLIDGGSFAFMAFGLFFVAAGWVATGLNFIVTVHQRRAPGMGFFQMPIFSWSLYLTGYVLVFAGMVFGIIILYLAGAVATGRGMFSNGNNPLDWYRYFYFTVTPLVFFSLIPAVGLLTDVIVGISRKGLTGYRVMVVALVMLLTVGFSSWGMHLVGLGEADVVTFAFAIIGLGAIVPLAIITYSWLATMHKGAIACATPTTYVLAFLLNVGVGSVLGLFLSNPSLGHYLNQTIFRTAFVHYLLMGGVITAFLAGLHFWWPKITGRTYNQVWGRLSGILFTVGLNLAFFPQIILGTKGLAPALPVIPVELLALQKFSTLGMDIMLVGLISCAANLVASLSRPRQGTPDNPWRASTLEWRVSSPPTAENFAEIPEGGDPYPL
ncbi:hypothetical protein CSB20_10375 [bacterium DOLZORAL124_64_63]|nr:MAG: hypothetical protein CSB20_10375 [bacterium DOLZORAL124_64_63]